MSENKTVWGLHMGKHHGTLPLDAGYIALGWSAMRDLSTLNATRDAFKERLKKVYPDKKPGAIPVDAGVMFRFVHEMLVGDLVIYPSKHDRMVNIGEIIGGYKYNPDGAEDDDYTHIREVKWLASFPRTTFSQAALYEIGSFITLFQVSTNTEEFLAALRGEEPAVDEEDSVTATVAAEQVEDNTEDFVIRRLKSAMTPEKFEHFVAHLLECMGYHARVTQYSNDGGIDIIAHRDELGFEPPVIKVQCKQVVNNIGRPDVQQLMGAVEQQEFGLFVTLGGFTREAIDAERSRPNLRLLDGPALTQLVFEHYDRFEPQWQSLVPLKRRYIPGSI